MADPVRTEVVDGVLVVTLDRPTANAVDVTTSRRCTTRSRASRTTPACASGS